MLKNKILDNLNDDKINFQIITTLKTLESEFTNLNQNVTQNQLDEWNSFGYDGDVDWNAFWDEPEKLYSQEPDKFIGILQWVKQLPNFEKLIQKYLETYGHSLECYFSSTNLFIDQMFKQKKSDDWRQDKEKLEKDRESTKKKIKEWENEEQKNLNKDLKNDVNFEIIDELLELGAFSNLKTQWKEKHEENFPENFWRTKQIEKEWIKDSEECTDMINKLMNLEGFQSLKTEWEEKNENYGKKLDHYFPHPDWLIKETLGSPEKAEKKKFGDMMTYFALGGLVFLGMLIIFSGYCATECGAEEITLEDGTKAYQSINIPLRILESQLMIVFVATVIGPVVLRILKEKYDIQIETEQFNMITQDTINTVKMYNYEANKLRNADGKLDEISQRKLRNLAFSAIKQNYDLKKYNEIVKSLGVQVFEKAIEKALDDDKKERLPIEREKIKEIISQAIDAVPHIIEWQKTDENVKKLFLDGNVRRLLATMGIEGWAYKQLESIFDADASKRILAAAIADKNQLLSNVEDKNLLYLSTVVSSTSESLSKSPTT